MKMFRFIFFLLILIPFFTSKLALGQIKIKGQGQMKVIYDINEFSESGIDAAIRLKPYKKNYFFKGNSYTRLSEKYADSNYPKELPGGWTGLPTSWNSGIDAAFYHQSKEKAYFFKGGQYSRLTGSRIDTGYPRRLPGGWKGLPSSWYSGVDAAFYYEPNNKVYFFKGNQYARLTGFKVDNGYPKDLPVGWQGLPSSWHSGIDAAVFIKGHAYFFKGNEYIRFTGTKADNGYPLRLPGGWVFQRNTEETGQIAEGNWIMPSAAPFNVDIRSNFSFPLENTIIQKVIGYGERRYGINLVWYDLEEGYNFGFKKISDDDNDQIRYGDFIAIRSSQGGGWITYKEREYGINLGWSDTPEYEWEITGAPIGRILRTEDQFDLFNHVIKDKVIYCERSYGINLRWASDCGEVSPPPPQQERGFRQGVIFNCHNQNRALNLWTYDFTAEIWTEHGTLSAQWSGGSCPATSASPLIIPLIDGHLYRLVAVDTSLLSCDGQNNPERVSCQKLLLEVIRGADDGPILSVTVN